MGLKDKNYRIVTEPDEADSTETTPIELEDELEDLYLKANKGKASVKGRLEKLIKRYPKLPFLRNYLVKWYAVNKRPEDAYRINEEILKLSPNYVFAIAYKTKALIENNDIENLELLLAGRLDIESFYPGRRAFHISEFRAVISIAVEYLCATDRFDEAEERITLLAEADLDDSVSEALTMRLMQCRFLKGSEMRKRYAEMEIHAAERKDYTIPQSEVLMIPLSSRFEFLYGRQWEIEEAKLRDSVQNYKEELIAEINHILVTAVEGYEYIELCSAEANDYPATVLHAMLLLPYLDDDASFSSVLEILRQPGHVSEFWIGDWMGDLLLQYFKRFTEAKLKYILDFVLESPGNTFSKTVLLELLPKFVLNTPDSRETLVHCLKTIFEYFISNRDDETVFDSDVLAFTVGAAVDLKATELMDTITFLYESNWVSLTIEGDINEVKGLITSNESTLYGTFFEDVFAHLKDIHDKEEHTSAGEEFGEDDFDFSFPDDEMDDEDDYKLQTVKPNIYINVSRNAACPCGSGKKYKRCHGK